MISKKNIKFLLLFILFPVFSFSQYSGGTGTMGDPFQISSLTDLTTLATTVNAGTDYNGVYFILTADIDASATRTINQALNGTYQGFDPIGQTGNVFDGFFNGQNFAVNNLYINRPTADNIGLFGLTGAAAVIQNLEIYNGEITGQDNVGGIAGTFAGASINDVHTDGKITGRSKTGGIAGILTGTIIKNAFSTGYINGTSNTGGIAGELNNAAGSLQNTYNTALVNGTTTVGGLIGLFTAGAVNDSYNVGAVSGNYYIGALVGDNTNETIARCYFNPQTSNTERAIGTGTLSSANINYFTKTRTEMALQATYTGWTFDATNWVISNGNTLPYFTFQKIVTHNTDFSTVSETSVKFISQVLRNTDGTLTITEHGFAYSSTNPLPDYTNAAGVTTGLSISTVSNTSITEQTLSSLFEHQRYYGRFYAKDNNNKYHYGNTLLLLPPEEIKLLSAVTNSARNSISLEFDRPINVSTLTASQFNVKSDETNITISGIELHSTLTNIVELNLSQSLAQIPVVTVTYTAGTLAGTDGGRAESFTNYTVLSAPEYNGRFTVSPDLVAINQLFGNSIASFGEYLVVGCSGESFPAANTGVVYVFKRSGQKFSKIAELTASDGATNDYFGISVDIYNNIIVVGAYGDNSSTGSVYVFEKPGLEWSDMTEVAKLIASDGASSDNLGYSVAVSGDVIVAGARGENSNRGAGYVFIKPNDGWKNVIDENAKLVLASGTTNDVLGTSVAITSDYVVLGAPGNVGSEGKAYIFEKPKDGWKNSYQTAELSASDGANANTFGVSVSANKNYVAVGATGATSTGAVYFYSKPLAGWSDINEIRKIVPIAAATSDFVGQSVDLKGSKLAVGASDNSTSGSVFIFQQDPADETVWTQTNKINSGSADVNENLGVSVSINGNFLISGSSGTGGASGSVQIYNSNTKPTGNTASVSLPKNSTYTFTKSDFPFTDPDASDDLYAIEIKTLPSKGTFRHDGVNAAVNTVYPDLTKFTYDPVVNETGSPYVDFSYKLVDLFEAKSVLNYTMTVNVSDVNTPPTGRDTTITINEDEDYIISAKTTFGYSDSDDNPMNSAIITLLPDSGKLYLDNNTNNIIDSGEELTLNSEILIANITAGIFKYEPVADSSGSPFTTFNFKVTDDLDTSTSVYTITFNVNAVNDAPVLSNIETTPAEYTIGKDSAFVTTSLTISDVDNKSLTKASVRIASGFDVDDTLSFSTQSGISGIFSNGEMLLSGSTTYGNYAKAIQSVSFRNYDVENPNPGIRTIGIKVFDGTDWSSEVFRNLNVIVIPDEPIIEMKTPVIVQEGQSTVISELNLEATNPDNTASDLTYFINETPINGTLSHPEPLTQADIDADLFIYTHNGSEIRNDSIRFQVKNKNGVFSSDTLLYITITNSNDPPVFSNIPEIKAKEDSALILPVSTWYPYISDSDNADSTLYFTMEYSGENIIVQSNSSENRVTEFILRFSEEWSGRDSVLLIASDGAGLDSANLIIVVEEINDNPKFVDFPAFVEFQNDQFFKGNIWKYVDDVETPDSLLTYDLISGSDSLSVSFSKSTGNFWLDALPFFGGETSVKIKVEDPENAVSDTTLIVRVIDVFTDVTIPEIPKEYFLYQNYPNPFNPETIIKFALPEESDVKLSIYNIVGEKITVLVNEVMESGIHKSVWKAGNYSSGIYIYKIEASSTVSDQKFNKVEKMLLIK